MSIYTSVNAVNNGNCKFSVNFMGLESYGIFIGKLVFIILNFLL